MAGTWNVCSKVLDRFSFHVALACTTASFAYGCRLFNRSDTLLTVSPHMEHTQHVLSWFLVASVGASPCLGEGHHLPPTPASHAQAINNFIKGIGAGFLISLQSRFTINKLLDCEAARWPKRSGCWWIPLCPKIPQSALCWLVHD